MKKVRKCVLFAVFASIFAGQISTIGENIHTVGGATITYPNRLVTINGINALVPKDVAFAPLENAFKKIIDYRLITKYYKEAKKHDKRMLRNYRCLFIGTYILYLIIDGSSSYSLSYSLTVCHCLAQNFLSNIFTISLWHPTNKAEAKSSVGDNILMAYGAMPRFAMYYIQPPNKLQLDPMPKEIKTVAEKTLSKLCKHPKEIVLYRDDTHYNTELFSFRTQQQKYIGIGTKKFDGFELTKEQLEQNIAHEYSHILHNDPLTNSLIYLITPIAVECSLRLGNHLVQILLNELEKHLPKNKTHLINKVVVTCKNTSKLLATSCVAKMLVTHFIMLYLFRKQETRCDIEAARWLGKAQPGIDFMTRVKNSKASGDILDKAIDFLINHHPSEANRIAALQKLSIEELGSK